MHYAACHHFLVLVLSQLIRFLGAWAETRETDWQKNGKYIISGIDVHIRRVEVKVEQGCR